MKLQWEGKEGDTLGKSPKKKCYMKLIFLGCYCQFFPYRNYKILYNSKVKIFLIYF